MKEATRKKEDYCKLNIEVNKHKLQEIKSHLQYGQLTFIISTFLDELHKRVQSGDFNTILDWLYKDKPLTLKEENK